MQSVDLKKIRSDAFVPLASFDTNEKSKALTIFKINLQILLTKK
jgi:hypothetical protein